MNRAIRIGTKLAVGCAIAAAPVVMATTAQAGPYTTPPITVSTSTPAPGGTVQLTATGFQPDSSVQIFVHSTPVLLATVTSDANGTALASVTLPADLANGSHDLLAEGTDPSGAPLTDTMGITVGASTALPFTGFDVAGVAATGAGLVGFGSFLVFTNRRKHAARAS